jgi:hypothetical protein
MRAICHFARQTSLWGIATVPEDHSPKVIISARAVFDLQQINVARAHVRQVHRWCASRSGARLASQCHLINREFFVASINLTPKTRTE